jgi:hypothetical protein
VLPLNNQAVTHYNVVAAFLFAHNLHTFWLRFFNRTKQLFLLLLLFLQKTILFILQAYSSKNGTGITIPGDYGDLMSLYDTVHHFANALDEKNKLQKPHHQLLMNFAYEIRKGYSGEMQTEKIKFDNDQE